jgi:hypothetical protein
MNGTLVHIDFTIGTRVAVLALATQLSRLLNNTTFAIVLAKTLWARGLNVVPADTLAQTLVK